MVYKEKESKKKKWLSINTGILNQKLWIGSVWV